MAKNGQRQKLSADDLSYHRKMIAGLEAAMEFERVAADHRAAWQSWAAHIQEKYALDGNDKILASGAIERG